MRIFSITLITISISLTTGCSLVGGVIPTPDKDMKTVYDSHMSQSGEGALTDQRSVLRRPMVEDDVDLSEYVRSEKDQLMARFQMLPNPMMYMFVAPHLSTSSNVPIPGYLTAFKMWETDHFALPGEVSDMSNDFEGE